MTRRLKVPPGPPLRLSRLAGYVGWFTLPWVVPVALVGVVAALLSMLLGCVTPPDDGARIYGPDWPLSGEYVVRYASPGEIAAARERIPAARLPDDGTVLAYTDLSKTPCEITLPFPAVTPRRLLADLRHHEQLHCEYGEWHDRDGNLLRR